jgi:hypothetical protein
MTGGTWSRSRLRKGGGDTIGTTRPRLAARHLAALAIALVAPIAAGAGAKVDTLGNVYVCGPGSLWISSPLGKALGR